MASVGAGRQRYGCGPGAGYSRGEAGRREVEIQTRAEHKRARRGFSLLELLVTLTLVVLLATVVNSFLTEEPARARGVQVKSEMQHLHRKLRAAALNAPGFHFETIEAGLGLSEPVLDPWGRPYVLLHGAFRRRPQEQGAARCEAFPLLQPESEDAGPTPHTLCSEGPTEGTAVDLGPGGEELRGPLVLPIQLGVRPRMKQAPLPPQVVSLYVGVEQVRLEFYQLAGQVPDRLVLERETGARVAGPFLPASYPGHGITLDLMTGLNRFVVRRAEPGSVVKTWFGVHVDNVNDGTSHHEVRLLPGEPATLELIVRILGGGAPAPTN